MDRMMEITFPGGEKVVARYGKFVIETDQPIEDGGGETAPSPFDLFIASIGTCIGYYVMSFCKQRGISFENIKIYLEEEWNLEVKRITRIKVSIDLPSDFPSKYLDAIVKTAERCTVKRHLDNPPDIIIEAKSVETKSDRYRKDIK